MSVDPIKDYLKKLQSTNPEMFSIDSISSLRENVQSAVNLDFYNDKNFAEVLKYNGFPLPEKKKPIPTASPSVSEPKPTSSAFGKSKNKVAELREKERQTIKDGLISSDVTADLLSKGEEAVRIELKKKLDRQGFKIEETGFRDNVRIVAPNQSVLDLKLSFDNQAIERAGEIAMGLFTGDVKNLIGVPSQKESKFFLDQASKLRSFIDQNTQNASMSYQEEFDKNPYIGLFKARENIIGDKGVRLSDGSVYLYTATEDMLKKLSEIEQQMERTPKFEGASKMADARSLGSMTESKAMKALKDDREKILKAFDESRANQERYSKTAADLINSSAAVNLAASATDENMQKSLVQLTSDMGVDLKDFKMPQLKVDGVSVSYNELKDFLADMSFVQSVKDGDTSLTIQDPNAVGPLGEIIKSAVELEKKAMLPWYNKMARTFSASAFELVANVGETVLDVQEMASEILTNPAVVSTVPLGGMSLFDHKKNVIVKDIRDLVKKARQTSEVIRESVPEVSGGIADSNTISEAFYKGGTAAAESALITSAFIANPAMGLTLTGVSSYGSNLSELDKISSYINETGDPTAMFPEFAGGITQAQARTIAMTKATTETLITRAFTFNYLKGISNSLRSAENFTETQLREQIKNYSRSFLDKFSSTALKSAGVDTVEETAIAASDIMIDMVLSNKEYSAREIGSIFKETALSSLFQSLPLNVGVYVKMNKASKDLTHNMLARTMYGEDINQKRTELNELQSEIAVAKANGFSVSDDLIEAESKLSKEVVDMHKAYVKMFEKNASKNQIVRIANNALGIEIAERQLRKEGVGTQQKRILEEKILKFKEDSANVMKSLSNEEIKKNAEATIDEVVKKRADFKIQDETVKDPNIYSEDEGVVESSARASAVLIKDRIIEGKDRFFNIGDNVFPKVEAEAPLETAPLEAAPVAEEVAPQQPSAKVSEALNRPVTITKLGGSTLDTPIKGDMFIEGQQLIVEDENGNITELGNYEELSDMSAADLSIEYEGARVIGSPEGGLIVDGLKYTIQDDLPTKGMVFDKDGTVLEANIKDENGKPVMFKGDLAQDIWYQMLLKEATSPELADKIDKLLERDGQFKTETRKQAEPVARKKPKPAKKTAARQADTDTKQDPKEEIEKRRAQEIKDNANRIQTGRAEYSSEDGAIHQVRTYADGHEEHWVKRSDATPPKKIADGDSGTFNAGYLERALGMPVKPLGDLSVPTGLIDQINAKYDDELSNLAGEAAPIKPNTDEKRKKILLETIDYLNNVRLSDLSEQGRKDVLALQESLQSKERPEVGIEKFYNMYVVGDKTIAQEIVDENTSEEPLKPFTKIEGLTMGVGIPLSDPNKASFRMADIQHYITIMFKKDRMASIVRRVSGTIDAKVSAAFKIGENKRNEYKSLSFLGKLDKKQLSKFNTSEDQVERVFVAEMLKTRVGEDPQASFDQKRKFLFDNYDKLGKLDGTNVGKKRQKTWMDTYDRLFAGAESIEEVIARADKNNVAAVRHLIDMFSEIKDPVFDHARDYYAIDPTEFNDYTPSFYSSLLNTQGQMLVKNDVPVGSSTFQEAPGFGETERVLIADNWDEMVFRAYENSIAEVNTRADIDQLSGMINSPRLRSIFDTESRSTDTQDGSDFDILVRGFNDKIEKVSKTIGTNGSSKLMPPKVVNSFVNMIVKGATAKRLLSVSQRTAQATSAILATSTIVGHKARIELFKYYLEFMAGFTVGKTLTGDVNSNVGLGAVLAKSSTQARTGKEAFSTDMDKKAKAKLIDNAAERFAARSFDALSKPSEYLLNIGLGQADAIAGKASFAALYYDRMLQKNPSKIKDMSMDEFWAWSENNIDMDAVTWADSQIARAQMISLSWNQGNLFDPENGSKWLTSMLFPFGRFAYNRKVGMANDWSIISDKSVATDADKAMAKRRLASAAVEIAIFKVIQPAVGITVNTLFAQWIGQLLGWDEEFDKIVKQMQDNFPSISKQAIEAGSQMYKLTDYERNLNSEVMTALVEGLIPLPTPGVINEIALSGANKAVIELGLAEDNIFTVYSTDVRAMYDGDGGVSSEADWIQSVYNNSGVFGMVLEDQNAIIRAAGAYFKGMVPAAVQGGKSRYIKDEARQAAMVLLYGRIINSRLPQAETKRFLDKLEGKIQRDHSSSKMPMYLKKEGDN